jgi:regulator of protease activity HflC (stomatin/prohibitin superfamily)
MLFEKLTKKEQKMKISLIRSIAISIILSLSIGFVIALPSGLGAFGVIAITLIIFGILLKGSFTVPINHVAVLKLFGKRQNVLFSEGWNITIPFITDHILVDLREYVWQIPDPEKEAGKDGFTFFTGVKPGKGERVELRAKVVLKFKIKDPLEFLSNNPEAISIALRTKAVDEIRTRGANMSAEEFIADKSIVAEEVKIAVDNQYDCIEVTGLDIAKADYADLEIKKVEQSAKLERSKTKSQANDMLGEGGTSDRIAQVAEMLKTAGLPADEAARKAIEIVQTQEGRMTHSKIELAGGSNPIAEAIALWKGGKI